MNTVLIVEDEKMIRQGILTMIQRSRVSVGVIIECSNGEKALEILQEQKVDVMFTDIRMPKMGGIELVKAIQNLKNKPLIVVISGYDDFSYAVEMMRLGVREYILKPVDRNKIKEILEKLEEEIEKNNVKENENRNICQRQLKYLMKSGNITLKEVEIIINQSQAYFFSGNYVVCCNPKSHAEYEESNQFIYLSDVEANDVFIVSEENKNYLLKNELKNTCTGVSSPHQGLLQLKIAYEEAKAARKQAFVTGENKVEYRKENKDVSYYDRMAKGETQEAIDSNRMKQIGQMIGTEKIQEALKILEHLKKEIKAGKYNVDDFEIKMNILLDSIVTTYRKVLPLEEDKLEKFRYVLSSQCMEDYFQELLGWMSQINDNISTQFDDYKNKHKIQTALEYVRKNYNKDLNMAVVSNSISMNYSLFSFLFKEYTGSNFVNYLKILRMNEAKRLLAETEMRVNEISQKVGYNNEKHFMKLFKNTCGVSPTEYRRNMQFKN